MSMPIQKPGRSKQDYGTPPALIHAFERKQGNKVAFDLAAHSENAVHERYWTEQDNSLVQDWHKINGLLWLNPPFANIGLWAAKCNDESKLGAYIGMLTPASVGSNWFANYCAGKCRVIFLRPRLTFVGESDPYPKDCMITLWGPGVMPGYEIWNWREQP